MSEDTESELLASARAGDPRALEALLMRHQGSIYRFGMRMCRDPEDAKDVLQETLLAAAKGLSSFRGTSSIATWLYAIARSFCFKQRRRGEARARQGDEATLADEAPSEPHDPGVAPDGLYARKELERAIERALTRLDPRSREVLLLRDVEGLSAAEAAAVLSVSVEAVKSRLHRARRSLRAELTPLLDEAEAPPSRAEPCPDVLTLFSQHEEQELSAEVCARMQQHLAHCARCVDLCESLRRTLALCRALPHAEVPPQVQGSVRAALRDLSGTRAS